MITPSREPTELKIGNSTIRIGRYSYGLSEENISQWNEGANLTIGAFCSIALRVRFFLGGNHRTDWLSTYPFGHIFSEEFGPAVSGHPAYKGDIVIGNDVWLGDSVWVMSGVTIGDGAVVAANSHVVKDIPAYEIWGGNPARKIRDRFPEEKKAELLALQWWDWPTPKIREFIPMLASAPENLAPLLAVPKMKEAPSDEVKTLKEQLRTERQENKALRLRIKKASERLKAINSDRQKPPRRTLAMRLFPWARKSG